DALYPSRSGSVIGVPPGVGTQTAAGRHDRPARTPDASRSPVERDPEALVARGGVRGVAGAGGDPVAVAVGGVAQVGAAAHHAGLAVSRAARVRSEEHTSELQSRENLVCRLLLEKKKRMRTHAW